MILRFSFFPSLSISLKLAKAKQYHAKLTAIKKEMLGLTDRMQKIKVRQAKG